MFLGSAVRSEDKGASVVLPGRAGPGSAGGRRGLGLSVGRLDAVGEPGSPRQLREMVAAIPRQAYREGQEDQLGLVLNVVVLWSTGFIDVTVAALRSSGCPAADEDAARLR